jgi:hypothetical protein
MPVQLAPKRESSDHPEISFTLGDILLVLFRFLIPFVLFLTGSVRRRVMSSSQESDQGDQSDRKPISFVKSVIKALSGSRSMTPGGSERDDSTGERNDAVFTNRNPGQTVDQFLGPETTNDDRLESLGERGYEPDFLSLPMDVLDKTLRYIGRSDELSPS